MLNSPVDLAIVGVVILIVFGPKKVPELGRALGQGIGNFKKALTDASEEVKAGVADVEQKVKAEPNKSEPGSAAAAEEAPKTSAVIKDG